jgi:hypothetical protein
MEFQADLNYSNTNLAYQNITNIDGVTQVNMLARFYSTPVSCPSDNYTSVEYAQLASFTNTSQIYNEWTNKPEAGLGVNETYLIVGSQLANSNISIGDNITTMIQFPTPKYYNTTTIYLNLTVAGFAELTDNGYSLVSGGGYYYTTPSTYGGYSGNVYNSHRSDLMIVSWENTLQKLWAATPPSSTVTVIFSINVDRAKLVSPWNISTSVDNVNVIADNIQNQILGSYLSRGSLNNMLTPALQGFDANFSSTLKNIRDSLKEELSRMGVIPLA